MIRQAAYWKTRSITALQYHQNCGEGACKEYLCPKPWGGGNKSIFIPNQIYICIYKNKYKKKNKE